MRKITEELIGLLYPKRCPLCQDILIGQGARICTSCRKKAVPIREPKCKKCGKPIRSAQQEYCFDCSGREHYFTGGWAVFPYEKEIKQSVYQFKFHNKREYSDFYVSEMAGIYGHEILRWQPDVLIPIPMYRKKQRVRGYNQAEILAGYLGEYWNLPVDTELLKNYVITGQSVSPNTELKYVFSTDSEGNEYDNLVQSQNIEEIEITVKPVGNN